MKIRPWIILAAVSVLAGCPDDGPATPGSGGTGTAELTGGDLPALVLQRRRDIDREPVALAGRLQEGGRTAAAE